jgi:vacuolar-type H+-ATPase subunit F/Vma7
MGHIAVIGDTDTVLTFRLGGVEGYVATNADSARRAVMRACDRGEAPQADRTKLLLVTQQVAEWAGDLLQAEKPAAAGPMVLEIPGFAERAERRPLQRLLARVLRIAR